MTNFGGLRKFWDKWGYGLLFCIALIPLFWRFWDEKFWSDEYYSIYFSQHFSKAIFGDPHLPFVFLVNWVFVSLFGQDSFLVNLNTLLPIVLAWWALTCLCQRYANKTLFFCLTLVFVLNPVFLQFARSIRSNGYLYVTMILTVWFLFTATGAKQRWALFLLGLIGGTLFFFNSVASLLVIVAYGLITGRTIWGPLKASVLGGLGVVAMIFIKRMASSGFPYFFSVPVSGDSLLRLTRYFFSFPEECFCFDWKSLHFGIPAYLYADLFSVMMAGLFLLTLFGTWFCSREIFRSQVILIALAIIGLTGVFFISWLGIPILSFRMHLYLYALVLVAFGLGLYAIFNTAWGKLLIGIFALVSIAHLWDLGFYEVQPQEDVAIGRAAQFQGKATLIGCTYGAKYELLGLKNVHSDCRDQNFLTAIKGDQIVVLEEFFNPGTEDVFRELERKSYRLLRTETFNYSKVHVFGRGVLP
jgi:hypothetical protein